MQCSNGGEAYLGWRADILEDVLSIGPVEGRTGRGLEVKHGSAVVIGCAGNALRNHRLELEFRKQSETRRLQAAGLRQHLVADNTFITTAISITVSSFCCREPIVTFARVMF